MLRRHVSLALLLLVSPSVAFSLGGPPRPTTDTSKQPAARNWAQDAWARYVLIRPEETPVEDLNWWEKRTPGTARTIVFSSLLCTAAAIPLILTNPVIFLKLLELASLDRCIWVFCGGEAGGGGGLERLAFLPRFLKRRFFFNSHAAVLPHLPDPFLPYLTDPFLPYVFFFIPAGWASPRRKCSRRQDLYGRHPLQIRRPGW